MVEPDGTTHHGEECPSPSVGLGGKNVTRHGHNTRKTWPACALTHVYFVLLDLLDLLRRDTDIDMLPYATLANL